MKEALTRAGPAAFSGLVAGLLAGSGPAQAIEVTTNVGYLSEYVFRGVHQADSSANGGLDVKAGGFRLGTWAADAAQGMEVDLYGGYDGSVGGLRYGVGATGYFYTDDFDDTYREINLSLGYGIFSVAGAIGEYDNFKGRTDGTPGAMPNRQLDYTFIAPRLDYRGFYGLIGIFGNDLAGEYYEVGYGATLAAIGVDWTVSWIHGTDDLPASPAADSNPDDNNSLVLGVKKSFTLGSPGNRHP